MSVMDWTKRQAHKRWIINTAITIVGVIAVAVAGLVVEDILPRSGCLRFLVAIVFLALLVFLVWWRTRLNTVSGTFYYVRLLEGWMQDRHLEEERSRRRDHLDERVISRNLIAQPVGGVRDIASEVMEVARDLQMTMNEDDIGTGFTLAPNVLWPMAMSLGYDLFAWPDLQLRELSDHDERQRITWTMNGQVPDAPSGFAIPLTTPDLRSSSGPVLVVAELSGQGPADFPNGVHPQAVYTVHVRSDGTATSA